MAALLVVSLGPVQAFIASARRCQDLWFGSWLLSHCARRAASAMSAAAGGAESLVFPASVDSDETAVANKILVRVPDGASPRDIADRGRAAVEQHLRAIAHESFDGARLDDGRFDRQAAFAQIDDLLEYVWASVPLVDDASYAAARRRADALLAARKNTRTWGSCAAWSRGAPKSSLDGARESVLCESLYGNDCTCAPPRHPRTTALPARALRSRFHVKSGERLCGVGMLKRVGGEARPHFHSTSHVASAPLREGIVARDAQAALGDYLDTLERLGLDLDRFRVRVDGLRWRDGQLDGELLFEDRLRHLFEHYSDAEDVEGAVGLAAEKLRALRARVGADVPAYYAILLADGDDMGRAIDAIGTMAGHRALSDALDRFARGCRGVVERHRGSLVYAGGDDVLALLPLHTALACARALHDAFDQAVGRAACAQAAPTLSVGLAVVHHMDPMGEALEHARSAERLAKSVDGKNALAVLLTRRSGGAIEAAGRWTEQPPLDRRLERWVHLLRSGAVARSAAFDLEAALAPLLAPAPGRGGDPPSLAQVAASLAERALARARQRGGAEAIDPEVASLLRARAAGGVDEVLAAACELQIAGAMLGAHEAAGGPRA